MPSHPINPISMRRPLGCSATTEAMPVTGKQTASIGLFARSKLSRTFRTVRTRCGAISSRSARARAWRRRFLLRPGGGAWPSSFSSGGGDTCLLFGHLALKGNVAARKTVAPPNARGPTGFRFCVRNCTEICLESVRGDQPAVLRFRHAVVAAGELLDAAAIEDGDFAPARLGQLQPLELVQGFGD